MNLSERVFQVDELDSVVVEYDWAFARDRAKEIDRHWELLISRQPQLFNGKVYLTCEWGFEQQQSGRVLRTRHFQTDYKSFLAWRDFGFPDKSVANCFASSALAGSDGVFVLAEMASHTANAGRVYFPCGTPDPADLLSDGRLDLAGSVLRELQEETALAHPIVAAQNGWTIVNEWPRLACLKDVVGSAPGAAIAALINSHISGDDNPELVRVHLATGLEDMLPDVMPGYVTEFLRSRFSQPAG